MTKIKIKPIKISLSLFTNNKNELEKRDMESPKFVVKTFALANEYREVAHKLKAMQGDLCALPSPIVMLYSFSCELFLKALIKFCDKKAEAHGHELKELFDKIQCNDIKKTIKNAYAEKFGEYERKMDSSSRKIFPIGFEATLKRFNTAFEYLRYENEYEELWEDSTFLPWFSDALHIVASNTLIAFACK